MCPCVLAHRQLQVDVSLLCEHEGHWIYQTASHNGHRESSSPLSAQCCSGCLLLFSQSMLFRTLYKHSPWYPYGISGAFLRHLDLQIFDHKTRRAFLPVQAVAFLPLWGCPRWSCVSGRVSLDPHPGWNPHHTGHTCQSLIVCTAVISKLLTNHLKGLSPVCIFTCLSNICCLTKPCPQKLHWKGFSWPCSRTPWTVNLSTFEKLWKQVCNILGIKKNGPVFITLHWKGSMPWWIFFSWFRVLACCLNPCMYHTQFLLSCLTF